MKKIIDQLLPSKLRGLSLGTYILTKNKFYGGRLKHINISYSQEGEDLFLKRFFGNKKKGFYVDIGAHHPKKLSNTYIFYRKGWRGINIDAMPDSMKPFRRYRSEDINLEIGVGLKNTEKLQFHVFDEPALNTFSSQVAQKADKSTSYNLIKTVDVSVSTLEHILDQYLPEGTVIDFINIDVEGFDLDVLKSNNWEKYRPKMILIESSHTLTIRAHLEDAINLFLESKGYSMYGKTFKTLFFKLNI